MFTDNPMLLLKYLQDKLARGTLSFKLVLVLESKMNSSKFCLSNRIYSSLITSDVKRSLLNDLVQERSGIGSGNL